MCLSQRVGHSERVQSPECIGPQANRAALTPRSILTLYHPHWNTHLRFMVLMDFIADLVEILVGVSAFACSGYAMCRLFACQIVQIYFSWLDQSQCRWALKRQMIEQVKQTLWRAAAVARPPMPAPTTKTGSLPFWFELPPSHQMVVWNVCCFRPSPLGAP